MNLPYFIAKRIARNKQASFSKFIIKLAILATALSVAFMIVSIAVVQGFKKNIEQKLFVFWDDFHISTFSLQGVLGNEVMQSDEQLESKIRAIEGVNDIKPYALKPAILKGNGPVSGLKLKGINADYPLESNASMTIEGASINYDDTSYSKDILLSPNILDRLDLEIGDNVYAYFIEPGSSTPRIRKLNLVGSYHTGVGEIDNTFALVDLRLIQKLNGWTDHQISGYQVDVKDYRNTNIISDNVYQNIIKDPLTTETIEEIYPSIFSWMDVQNINAQILIFIMAIVAIINIATALLIFILERTPMIGMLKSLGMTNSKIQSVFLTHAGIISIRGILIGNVIAIVFCFLQLHYQLIELDEEIYYMKYVPIHFNWLIVLIVDLCTLLLCYTLMILPSFLVRKVRIVQALKFN